MVDNSLMLVSCNRKGGCFKTSMTFHVGGTLAKLGQKVLLIDCDPQASLTQSFFGAEVVEALPDQSCLAALFDEALDPDPLSIIYDTEIENISIVPAGEGLTRHNSGTPLESGLVQDTLRLFRKDVGHKFDVILVDTAPNLQLLCWAAMVAADYVITPVIPEDYASQGLVHVGRFIQQVQELKNPKLGWMGLLITMVQPRVSVHVAYEQILRERYGDLVFQTTIPLAAPFKEAVVAKQPISHFKPRVAGAKKVTAFTEEILTRAGRPIPVVTKPKKKKKARAA